MLELGGIPHIFLLVFPNLYLRQNGLSSSFQVVVSYPEFDVFSGDHCRYNAFISIEETVSGCDDVSAGYDGSSAKANWSSFCISNTNKPRVFIDLKRKYLLFIIFKIFQILRELQCLPRFSPFFQHHICNYYIL